jgi:phage tail tape-measure protein
LTQCALPSHRISELFARLARQAASAAKSKLVNLGGSLGMMRDDYTLADLGLNPKSEVELRLS